MKFYFKMSFLKVFTLCAFSMFLFLSSANASVFDDYREAFSKGKAPPVSELLNKTYSCKQIGEGDEDSEVDTYEGMSFRAHENGVVLNNGDMDYFFKPVGNELLKIGPDPEGDFGTEVGAIRSLTPSQVVIEMSYSALPNGQHPALADSGISGMMALLYAMCTAN